MMKTRQDLQERLLGAMARNADLVKTLDRLGLDASSFDRDLRGVYRIVAAGQIRSNNAIGGFTATPEAMLLRKIHQRTIPLGGAQAVDLAKILLRELEPAEPHHDAGDHQAEAIAPPAEPEGELITVCAADVQMRAYPPAPPGKSRAEKVRRFLRAYIVEKNATVPATKLETLARNMGLLALDESIGKDRTWGRAARALNIERHREGIAGGGGRWVWRRRPEPFARTR